MYIYSQMHVIHFINFYIATSELSPKEAFIHNIHTSDFFKICIKNFFHYLN